MGLEGASERQQWREILSIGRDLGSAIGPLLCMKEGWPKVRIRRISWAGECLYFLVNLFERRNIGKFGARKSG